MLTYDISIELLLKKNNKQTQKKSGVNTRVPRPARWDFRGLLDDSLFLSLEFDMNKYLKKLRSIATRIGEIYCYYFFLFMEASLRCGVFVSNFGISLY